MYSLGELKVQVEYLESVATILNVCKGIEIIEAEDLGMNDLVEDFNSSPDEDEEDEYENFMKERMSKGQNF